VSARTDWVTSSASAGRPAASKLGTLRNEFTMIELERDETANGPRLRIHVTTTGEDIYLDPLELEAIVRMSHEEIAWYLDPSVAG
jgi:hypothetical protein